MLKDVLVPKRVVCGLHRGERKSDANDTGGMTDSIANIQRYYDTLVNHLTYACLYIHGFSLDSHPRNLSIPHNLAKPRIASYDRLSTRKAILA